VKMKPTGVYRRERHAQDEVKQQAIFESFSSKFYFTFGEALGFRKLDGCQLLYTWLARLAWGSISGDHWGKCHPPPP